MPLNFKECADLFVRTTSVMFIILLLSLQRLAALTIPMETEEDIILRTTRGFRHPIALHVLPEETVMYPGDSITIECSAKLEDKSNSPLYVNFYRLLDPVTAMPLSSGDPGVLIQPGIPSDEQTNENIKLLTLRKYAWYYLMDEGENMFYCSAQNDSGKEAVKYFKIIKKLSPAKQLHGRRQRRYLERQARRLNGDTNADLSSFSSFLRSLSMSR